MSGLHVVWFRRDLRVHDNAALAAALASGAPILPLYVFEPGLWAQPEASRRQFDFLMESLTELDEALTERGARLIVRTGEMVEVLADLHRRHGLAAIHVQADPGTGWARERDKAVQRWALHAGVSLREQAQPGPANWDEVMARPRHKAPDLIPAANVPSAPWPIAEDFGLREDACPGRQTGGRAAGVELLRSFLAGRGRRYRQAQAGLAGIEESCSRLSPHLAFGTVSVREAWQAAARARTAFALDGDTTFADSLDAFLDRLRWRGQSIEAFGHGALLTAPPDGLRPPAADGDPRLEAWIAGRTGFPFIDASLRALQATGWLPVRLRALLVGFAAWHLWMDWRRPAERLAGLFTDFEPGLHYSQVHRQAALTGPGAPRIFNPVKQSQEMDPAGAFIRRWVPELAALPAQYIHAPWEAPKAELARAGVVFGQTYPMRMLDHIASAREARERVAALRQPGPSARDLEMAGARAGVPRKRRSPNARGRKPAAPLQLSFDLLLPPPA
ncbi:MAG: deoxyribodipyrimidine photo-lyase [Hyphomonas sp.]|nr:deoxyribodipyrimidine photo-lyase [Hyphomonas sp.]